MRSKLCFSEKRVCSGYAHRRLLLLLLLTILLGACGPRVLVGPQPSESIDLPYPVWMVAERAGEADGYIPGDPFGVFVIAKDGELQTITDGFDWNPKPSWSPDSGTVAFWFLSRLAPQEVGAYYNLYVTDIGGAQAKPLTTEVEERSVGGGDGLYAAKWSPKGDRLAFIAGEAENGHLYVIDVDGSDLIDLMHVPAASSGRFSWDPRGQSIAVSSSKDGNSEIYLVSLDPKLEIQNLTTNRSAEAFPVWSPDGKYIAYFSDAGIQVMEVETRVARVLDGGSDYSHISGPLLWSPDNNWIAFVAKPVADDVYECENEEFNTAEYLFLLATDGSQVTRVTPVDLGYAEWAPNDGKLTFTLCNDVHSISIEDDTDAQKLTSTSRGYTGVPKWSPDGSKILFTVAQVHILPDRQLVATLYAINADGTNQLTLTDKSTNVNQFGWLNR